jgi:hypothetical protein
LPEVVFTLNDERETKSVSYGNMVALLIESVKEQDSKHSTLRYFYDIQTCQLSSLTSSYEILTQQEVSTQLMMSTLSGQQKQINDLAETVSSLVAKVGL